MKPNIQTFRPFTKCTSRYNKFASKWTTIEMGGYIQQSRERSFWLHLDCRTGFSTVIPCVMTRRMNKLRNERIEHNIDRWQQELTNNNKSHPMKEMSVCREKITFSCRFINEFYEYWVCVHENNKIVGSYFIFDMHWLRQISQKNERKQRNGFAWVCIMSVWQGWDEPPFFVQTRLRSFGLASCSLGSICKCESKRSIVRFCLLMQ